MNYLITFTFLISINIILNLFFLFKIIKFLNNIEESTEKLKIITIKASMALRSVERATRKDSL